MTTQHWINAHILKLSADYHTFMSSYFNFSLQHSSLAQVWIRFFQLCCRNYDPDENPVWIRHDEPVPGPEVKAPKGWLQVQQWWSVTCFVCILVSHARIPPSSEEVQRPEQNYWLRKILRSGVVPNQCAETGDPLITFVTVDLNFTEVLN